MYSSGTRTTIIIIGAYRAHRAAAETKQKVPTGIRLRCSDRSRLANCSDAPINMCQIGPVVTRQSRLIATLHSCAGYRLLRFLFLGRKSDKCFFLEKFWFGYTFCLALIASASLRPRREVTAKEQRTQTASRLPFLTFRKVTPTLLRL